MQYVLFTDKFGNFNEYMDPGVVGQNGSSVCTDIDFTDGTLRPRLADVVQTTGFFTEAEKARTIIPFGRFYVDTSKARMSYAKWGDRVYRAMKQGSASTVDNIDCIQYSNLETEGTGLAIWNCLGISSPGSAPTATAYTGGAYTLAAGTYNYYVTFYNAIGHESAPSAAGTATLSATGRIELTNIPIRYSQISFTSGQKTATVSPTTDASKFRAGMAIVAPAVAGSNRYITSVNYSTGAIEIDSNWSGSTSTRDVYDSQVIGRKIYREKQGDSASIQLISTIANMATTTLTDGGLTAGSEIQTIGNSVALNAYDISISPSGILMFIDKSTQYKSTIAYFSLGSAGLYTPLKVVAAFSEPLDSIYALNRFIFPTQSGAFTISLEDPTGVPVVSSIDNDEVSGYSYITYCLDIGGQVIWNTPSGIVATDGSTITNLTRFVFTDKNNQKLRYCYGMLYFGGDVYIYADSYLNNQDTQAIYVYNKRLGWYVCWLDMVSVSSSSVGTIGLLGASGTTPSSVLVTKDVSAPTPSIYKFQSGPSRVTGAKYQTGEWSGEHISNLKKFRKISFVHSGNTGASTTLVYVYVDGALSSTLTFPSVATKTRSSFWLPSGCKGRSVYLSITPAADVSIDEIGLWVGEQREAMP